MLGAGFRFTECLLSDVGSGFAASFAYPPSESACMPHCARPRGTLQVELAAGTRPAGSILTALAAGLVELKKILYSVLLFRNECWVDLRPISI